MKLKTKTTGRTWPMITGAGVKESLSSKEVHSLKNSKLTVNANEQ